MQNIKLFFIANAVVLLMETDLSYSKENADLKNLVGFQGVFNIGINDESHPSFFDGGFAIGYSRLMGKYFFLGFESVFKAYDNQYMAFLLEPGLFYNASDYSKLFAFLVIGAKIYFDTMYNEMSDSYFSIGGGIRICIIFFKNENADLSLFSSLTVTGVVGSAGYYPAVCEVMPGLGIQLHF